MCSVSNSIIMTLMGQDGKGSLWNCGWAERIPVNWRLFGGPLNTPRPARGIQSQSERSSGQEYYLTRRKCVIFKVPLKKNSTRMIHLQVLFKCRVTKATPANCGLLTECLWPRNLEKWLLYHIITIFWHYPT